jgi:predicted membrane-bound dolichyl-phosphate-mannose-protein mannosyltransferase
LKLEKKDAAIIATISALFFIVAAYNIGLTRIPSTTWSIKQETLFLTLDGNTTIDAVYLFVNTDVNATASLSTPRGTGWADEAWINDHGYYKWLRVKFSETTDRIRIHFYLPAGDVLEVAVVAADGSRVGIKSIQSDAPGDTDIAHLVDEQALFENPPTFRSETMFDEELFVRAAQEYRSLQDPVSEATHPPLGKLIIAAGITLFGFTPFGWRILGTVFAALMIPVIYALGYALFKTRAAATIAATLLALDFMCFAMSRVGTVDTFLIFFIMLSTLFFYLNYEKMTGGSKPDYRLLFAGIVCFSLAFSVKWIAIFGLIGEAALFLSAGLYGPSPPEGATTRLRALAKPIVLIACLIPAVGAVIYFGSFIPYAAIGHGLSDIWAAQWSMLGYHSSMGAYFHPNASNWYEWLIILKPLWLYVRHLAGDMLSTISAMGNPVVWWVGLCAVLVSLVNGAKKEWPHLFLGILYIAQLLPYALISRYLFIYHYYAEVPILALATAGLVHEMWYKPGQRKYVIILVAAAVTFFAVFYPVISGQVIPEWYSGYLHWFRDWVF